jgi:8-oxo-dGTP pyrophosphatase MutT (NUDIX family)
MRLDVPELRRRLAGRSPPEFSVYGDDGAGRAGTTAAAVLIPVVAHPGELTVLFTRRTQHLKSHSGQVSFPGGRVEPGDASVEFTALREAKEEIGLAAERVEILGRLPDYHTRTGFRVAPVIGLIAPPLALAPDPREVEAVFEVPLAFLLDTGNQQRHFRMLGEVRRDYFAIPYAERYIWGATAAMLVMLERTLRGS